MNAVYKTEAGRAAVAAAYADVLEHWPVACETLRLQTCQGETFAIACGAEDAPPLVLFHGAQTNAASWMFDVAAWSSHFRIYAVDMIGEPGFSAPVRPSLEGEAHALWLDDVLKGLDLTSAQFVGVSLGGWLALDYAIRRSERVEALVLIAPAGVGQQINLLAKYWPLLLAGRWGRRKMREIVLGPPPADLTPEQERLGALMDLALRHVRPRIVRIPLASDSQLAALSMPILAILGERDALIDTADARRRLETNNPRADIVWLEGVGHFVQGQTATIQQFLLETRR